MSTNSWAAIGTVTENKGDGCQIVRGSNKLSGTKGAGIESTLLVITHRTSLLTVVDRVIILENGIVVC